jgi:hypothetical protein
VLLSIRAYAVHRKTNGLPGGTHGAVRKAIETGRVKTVGGKIDPEQADADWTRKTDPGKQRGGESRNPVEAPMAAAAGESADPRRRVAAGDVERPDDPPSGQIDDYQRSRAAKEYWESELSRLKAEREAGNLISRESAEKAWGGMVVSTRTKALYLPSQLASRLASESDPITCEEILKDAVHKLLSELSEYRPE